MFNLQIHAQGVPSSEFPESFPSLIVTFLFVSRIVHYYVLPMYASPAIHPCPSLSPHSVGQGCEQWLTPSLLPPVPHAIVASDALRTLLAATQL